MNRSFLPTQNREYLQREASESGRENSKGYAAVDVEFHVN